MRVTYRVYRGEKQKARLKLMKENQAAGAERRPQQGGNEQWMARKDKTQLQKGRCELNRK